MSKSGPERVQKAGQDQFLRQSEESPLVLFSETNAENHWVHFIGIGGAGMSAIAKVLLQLGVRVSGSDQQKSKTTEDLQQLGAKVIEGHHADIIGDPDLVVVSAAVKAHNPELIAVRERGIPVWHRAEMLAALMRSRRGIAIAGAHGKTTTSSMMARVLVECGLDPTFIVGINDVEHSAHLGASDWLVAEADESDKSFMFLDPQVIVVTNVEGDHLDYYGTVDRVVEAFSEFLAKVPPDGLAVLCADNDYLQEIAAHYDRPMTTYGLWNHADYRASAIEYHGPSSRFRVSFRGEDRGFFELKVPGEHNVTNALAVIAVAEHLGVKSEAIAQALLCYTGVHRRFQVLGVHQGITVVSDYAHHPTEVRATLRAARQLGYKRVIVAFQPHLYSRTMLLKDDFARSFGDADQVVIAEIYGSREAPVEGVTAQILVNAIEIFEQRNVTFCASLDEVCSHLNHIGEPGDLILCMGAGSIDSAAHALARCLRDSST